MHTFLLQAGPPSSGTPGFFLGAMIPVILILTGTVLGCRALHDIRVSNGALGGAMTATFAAGLLPALFIVIACGVGLRLALMPLNHSRHEAWAVLGCGVGVGLSFRMMRGIYRQAIGGTSHSREVQVGSRHSSLTTAAILLTIAGSALVLVVLTLPNELFYVFNSLEVVLLLDLAILLAGLICGVIARRDPVARTCAWICGPLFVFLLVAPA